MNRLGQGKVVSLWRSADVPFIAIAVSIVVATANFGNAIVAPILPSIRDSFGSSAAEVALMVSGFAIGRLAMDLPAGFLTERFSPSRMFSAGIAISVVSSALAALSTTLQQLILFRSVMGFGSAILTTVAMVVVMNGSRPDQRGKVLALYTSAMLIGATASPIIGGHLASRFGWQSIFVFCAVTPLISFPLNLLLTGRAIDKENLKRIPDENQPPPAASPPAPTSHHPRSGNSVAMAAVLAGTLLAFLNRMGMYSTLLPLYGGSELGLDAESIGVYLSMGSILTSLVALPAGVLADRVGRKQILMPGLLLGVAGNILLLAGPSTLVFTTSIFLISATVIASNVLSTLVADLLPERSLGRGMGLYRFTCDIGAVVGPVTFGLVVDHSGFPAASILAAALVMVAVIACAWLVPGRKSVLPAEG